MSFSYPRDRYGFPNPDEELSCLFPEGWSRRSNTPPGSRELLCNDCSGTIVTTRNSLLSILPITTSICCHTLVRLICLHDCVVFVRSFQLSRKVKWLPVFHAQIENLKINMSHRIDHYQFVKLNDEHR